MSSDDRSVVDQQILAAIKELSHEVHGVKDDVASLSGQFGRLDERLVALDQKVDNRVQGVELKVQGMESRVQGLYDKTQDIEIRLNRSHDHIIDTRKDMEDLENAQEKSKDRWMNRFVIPILVAGAISWGSRLL